MLCYILQYVVDSIPRLNLRIDQNLYDFPGCRFFKIETKICRKNQFYSLLASHICEGT